jgi:hypothetical protein
MRFVPFLLLSVTLLASPASAARWHDPIIDRPRPLVQVNSLGRANLLMAGMGISIHRLSDMPEGRRVRLTGRVEKVNGSRLFILRDGTGRVEVIAPEQLAGDVKRGTEVSVAGRVQRSLFGTDIRATSVKPLNRTEEVVFEGKKRPLRARLASAD